MRVPKLHCLSGQKGWCTAQSELAPQGSAVFNMKSNRQLPRS